ncbi:MAG: magnesium transporter CorA family protein [Hyphomicrobiaceae bacterium]
MLTIYRIADGRLEPAPGPLTAGNGPRWIDLLHPSAEEDLAVETALSIPVPTRAEMREIEASNRLYMEGGAYVMTAMVAHNIEGSAPQFSAVTFILHGNNLVTVRYAEPKAFPLFLQRVDKGDAPAKYGAEVMIGLLESLIQRTADLIERVQDEVNRLATQVFEIKGGQQTRQRRLDVSLRTIGRLGETTSRAEESTNSLERLLIFLIEAMKTRGDPARDLQRVKSVQRDIRSLNEHLKFLNARINFLLDAVLGIISIEQNQIIKLFSVMAVMLMPPTLVASIYGMNFRHMPELEWLLGYPWALLLMLVAALVPYLYFRRKGWL